MKQVILEFGEEKKWSVRYNEPKDTPAESSVAKSVYVQKSALPTPYPRKLKLTLEVVP